MTRAFIDAVGARIATGVDALTSATTVRARKSFVRETRFVDHAGEPIGLSLVRSVPDDLVGRERFVPLAAPALAEAAAGALRPLPLILALPAEGHPLDPRGQRLLAALSEKTPIDVARSKVVAQGRAAAVAALEQAIERLTTGPDESILVGAVDSWFDSDRLEALDKERRLHGPETENGFIPGEGSAFVRLSRRPGERWGSIVSLASEREPRPYGSNEPCHALGMSLAATRALAGLAGGKVGWALTDVVGERHRVEEWLFAAGRVQAHFTPDAQHEQPLLVTGDLGAASALFLLVYACVGWRIGSAPAPRVLIAAHSDGAERGALLAGSVQ